MRILHINSIGGRTGSGKLCETIVQGLNGKGVINHTIVGYDFTEGKIPDTDSVFYTRNNLLYTYIYKFFIGLNFLFDFMRPGHLSYKKLKKNKYYQESDIVFIHCPEGGYFDWTELPIICREKKVIMILGDWIASGNDPDNYFFWKTRKSFEKRMRIIRGLDITHIGISNRIIKKGKEICGLTNIHTLYNGIDTSKFYKMDKEECRKRLGLPLDKKIILSIAGSGSKSNLKGIKYVEKIVAQFKEKKEYLFISIGNGHTDKNENYRELGLIPYDQINLYYNAADCFLYPTLADNCPLVILENLACGCPIVTFDVGGVAELVKHKVNGYVAKYKDADDLMKGFERAMKEPHGEIFLEEKFTSRYMIDQYMEIINKL